MPGGRRDGAAGRKAFFGRIASRELWNFASRRGKLLAGSFIFVETAVFREVGGFSRELFVAEELELSKRLKKFARGQGRGIVILHRHPLVTSARKMRLYTLREHLRFLAQGHFQPAPGNDQPRGGAFVV